MKRKKHDISEDDLFVEIDASPEDDMDDSVILLNGDVDSYDFNIDTIFEGEGIDDLEDIENQENDDDEPMSYKEYAMKRSNTKKVNSRNYDSADLYSSKQDINVPSDYIDEDSYFNPELENAAIEVIKGTSLERYTDGRHIPIKDVVICFVKLADQWPDDMVYCFLLIAFYGKVMRYKPLLDAIPTSYRKRMISQLSHNGAEMINSLYKGEETIIDIFC